MKILASDSDSVRTTMRSWQQLMRESYRDFDALCQELELPAELARSATGAIASFRLFAPPGYVAKIEKGNLDDPLLRQILPAPEEDATIPGFGMDPVGDADSTRSNGLLHKYQGRALLVLTGACGIHCRYCFRRHFPYEKAAIRPESWRPALEQIQQDTTLEEVILSGGDPLTLVDETLEKVVTALGEVPHLRRLRVHSRMPVVIPERVTDRFIEMMTNSRLSPIVVVHANHPNEIADQEASSLRRMASSGMLVFNQAVLLKGVNDTLDCQVELSRRLIAAQTTPYYLHQLDRVAGAAHFEVPVETGKALYEAMRQTLPGYALPRYVQENAGSPHKDWVD